jgi:DNA polymerase-3 subunit gamma/tau
MAKDPQTLPLLEVSDHARQRYQEQAQRADTRFLYGALRLMNQCDINYRQSSNKRLLVELTLIEVAQLTQPDEAPGSGRRPRRLKSLFKTLIQQALSTEKPAQQVAATVPQNQPKTAQAVAPAPPAAPKAPTLKVSQLGLSWNNLRQQKKKINILPGMPGATEKHTDEHSEFTQEELELQWLAMCNRMPQHLSGIAARMKNMNPVIVAMPAVEVVVPNEIVKTEVEQIAGSIVSTLKLYLHHSGITLSVRVAAQEERVKILTRREQFELMTSQNPSVEALRKAFDLELA